MPIYSSYFSSELAEEHDNMLFTKLVKEMAAIVPLQAVSPSVRLLLKNLKLYIADEYKHKELEIQKLETFLREMMIKFARKLNTVKTRIEKMDKNMEIDVN